MDTDILDRLNKIFPCREKQIITLNHLIGNVEETLPDCIFIYGNTSTGKTTIIKRFLSENNTNHVIVSLIECFSNKLIFESILNKFTNHSLVSNAYKPYVKCDNVYDFTTELIKANDEDGDLTPFIIVLDKVERLRSNELLLSVFLRLQEITKLNICVIMLSDIIFEHFFPTSLKSPIKVYFPHYTKDELLTILTLNFEREKSYIENEFNQPFDGNINFYKNYINIVLSVFYRACRDISEIKYVAHLNFKHYCEPVIKKILDENDVSGLWRNISPYLKSSLNILYLRFNTESDLKETKNGDELNRNIALTLELPFYAKYLLIAAYLASYNPIKEDKRLFMKYHGKKRNNKKRIESKQIVSEKTNIMLGPKMFTLDRLLAIFYAIIDEQVPLTSNLLVQLSSLVELKLLNLVGNDIDLSNHKYRCLVAYEFIETISKMVAHCYPEDLKTFPQLLMDLLQAHNTVLDPAIRMALCRGLILLRNKNLLAPTDLLSLFFQLLRCQDKNLRTFLETHIITDIKNVNAKHKNVKLNKTLQNFMYTMLRDNNSKAAKMSIDIMIELYKKNVWNDTKTVNVISTACFSKVTKVMVAALKFFLSVDSDEKGSDDSDSSDDEPNAKEVMMANKVNKKTRKRNKQLEKVKKLVTKAQKKKSQAPSFNFSALQLIHDPQDFAEKLFKQLESTNERFEVKLMHLDVISRLIGLHDLILLNFYPYVQRYLQPHQREVTRLLQFAAQASHELVPPDCLEPLLRTLVNNFVTERNSSDVIAIGLNAVREICARCPLVMTVDLLGDLTQYKNYRDKSVMMAARSLIGIYRNIAPEMLHKRDRGRPTEATIDLKLKQFGEVIPKDTVPGAEVLLEEKQSDDNEDNSDEDSDSDGWEDVSHSSDEDDEIAGESENEEDENKSGNMETEETKEEDISDKSTKAKEIVLDRLLTDEDFKRIEIANIKKQVQIVKKGEKRKLEAENNSPLVKLADIENIYKKRKHDKQTRIESVRKGQEGRDKFGYKDGRVNEFCSKTNREKQKKKNFQMIRHKARGKVKRSFKDKQIALRNHLLHLKKMK